MEIKYGILLSKLLLANSTRHTPCTALTTCTMKLTTVMHVLYQPLQTKKIISVQPFSQLSLGKVFLGNLSKYCRCTHAHLYLGRLKALTMLFALERCGFSNLGTPILFLPKNYANKQISRKAAQLHFWSQEVFKFVVKMATAELFSHILHSHRRTTPVLQDRIQIWVRVCQSTAPSCSRHRCKEWTRNLACLKAIQLRETS